MSATQFFADRSALLATTNMALRGLVSYTEINDKLNAQHLDSLFAVWCTYDNGCPEDYNHYQVGLFRQHADAAFVLQSYMKDSKSEHESYYIDVVRVY
jgi:hypothetical protein